MQSLKYSVQMQRIRHTERNHLVKVARWNVERFIVGQRPGSHKVALILQQICDLSTDRRGRAKRKSHSQPSAAKERTQLRRFGRQHFRLPALCQLFRKRGLLRPAQTADLEIHHSNEPGFFRNFEFDLGIRQLGTDRRNPPTSNSSDLATTESLSVLNQEQIFGSLTADPPGHVSLRLGSYADDAARE